VAVICGAAILWPIYKEKAKLAATAKVYRAHAEQGDANSQNRLGNAYLKGQGVPLNYAEAVRWYRKAADQGYALAQFDLAFMYYRGQGVPRDYVLAHMWMGLAASRASGDLKDNSVSGQHLFAQQMTAEQIAEAERLAGEWKPREPPSAAGDRDNRSLTR